MSDPGPLERHREVALVEVIDRVIDKGVVLTGDIVLSVADIDLVYVGLRLLIGDRRPYPVMLVVPNFEALGEWAAQNGVEAGDRGALLRDERVRRKMEAEVFGMLDGFARFEVPKKVALLEQGFTIEAGQMTPTLKVRRRVVEAECREVIEALYAESERLLVVE